jgi:Bifunctional DNA primase/polymerase, N-terminal
MHVRTGGNGAHVYFTYKYEDFPDGIDSKKYFVSSGDHQEIAINGNGRYVISPPSIHPSGNRYELMSDNLITLSKEETIELLGALDHLSSSNSVDNHHKNNNDNSETGSSSSSSIKLDEDKVTAIAQSLKQCYFRGNRDDIVCRNMLIKKSAALDALTAIVGAFERDDKAIINDNVTTPGYYLVDGKLGAYEVTQSISSWSEQSQVVLCTNILDELAKRYKNKDIFPTVIKWAIVAPFSYVLKGIDNNNWIPWLYGMLS